MMEHPKIVRLSDAAVRSHMKGLTYCARLLTDGFIPVEIATSITTPKVLSELTRGKLALWTKVRRGYLIPNYLEWNPSKAEAEARSRAGKQAAKARWADADRNANRIRIACPPTPTPTPTRRLLSLPNPESPPSADFGLLLR